MNGMKRSTGTYEKLGNSNFFIPMALPPENPPLEIGEELTHLYGSAMHRLGQLNEMALRLPDIKRFIKAYVIKEALLSSAIEGIHTTLLEVFTSPLSGIKPNKETQLVLNYSRALEESLMLMCEHQVPLCSRVILRAHHVLMSISGGEHADPGNYRKQAVRVGNLVPPPASYVPQLMNDLEKYINIDTTLPPLIKAGLMHLQFETIHPFLDGNGRIGRLLIVLMLIQDNVLQAPILYPSYYFKKNHFEYYQRLDRVRTDGDFEGWIYFYLKAIEESSFDAYQRVKDIENLEQESKEKLKKTMLAENRYNQAELALMILFQSPIISVTELAKQLKKSYNTASTLIQQFVALGVLYEMTEQKRNKLYRFEAYLNLLEKEYGVE